MGYIMSTTTSECNSAGRVSRCQRDCRRFESGHSLQFFLSFSETAADHAAVFFVRFCSRYDQGIEIGHHRALSENRAFCIVPGAMSGKF